MTPPSVQQRLVEAGRASLQAIGWDGDAEDDAVVAEYAGESGSWFVVIQVFPDQEVLLVYSIAATPVPLGRIALVGEYVNRVNDGLPRANLELDYETGVVKCRSYLDVEGVDVEMLQASGQLQTLVGRVLHANLATFDLALPGLLDVVEGRATPAEADANFGES